MSTTTTPDRLVVDGPTCLSGTVTVSGFKHALVTTLAAACCSTARTTLYNCPELAETLVLSKLINGIGGEVTRHEQTLTIEPAAIAKDELDLQLADAIHGSVYLVPALLARFGSTVVATGGGCRIGNGPLGRRPVDQYVAVLERFGATAIADEGCLRVAAMRLKGCDIDLLDFTADCTLQSGPLYSGATKMALLTAVVAYGTSVLDNPYRKPDVTDLVELLVQLGADIEENAEGSYIVRGRGIAALDRPTEFTLIADLIEIVTWICAGALLEGSTLTISGSRIYDAVVALHPEMEAFATAGVAVEAESENLRCAVPTHIRPLHLRVASHGIFSDSHPFFALLATKATGLSSVTETVWKSRFGYVPGLQALGATVEQKGSTVYVRGGPLTNGGQTLHAPDLRAAAVLVLAALAAKGTTSLKGASHLARGYRDFPGALASLGGRVVAEGYGH